MMREIGCLLAAAVLLVNLWLLWEFAPGFLAGGVALLVLGGIGFALLGDPEDKRKEAEEERMWRKLEELEAADDKETVYHACLLRRRLEADGIGEDEFVRLSQEVEARWESERRTGGR